MVSGTTLLVRCSDGLAHLIQVVVLLADPELVVRALLGITQRHRTVLSGNLRDGAVCERAD